MKILVTGSSGLIGAEAVRHFHALGNDIVGLDNNMRREFFGPAGDTNWQTQELLRTLPGFRHHPIDIRDREKIMELFEKECFDAVIHCAAQPSHDKARDIALIDFDVNAVGTVNLLEANRQYSPKSPFICMSTNKVYGDAPNEIELKEMETRWDYADPIYENGIPETFRIDQSKHSLFGASKVAADIMVQEYGRYFGMPTCCLRGGCLTGPTHSGVELHGFLSYLIKCNLEEKSYTVFGYNAKQVRDNIHSYDVVRFMEEFINAPRSGEVYNIGGGKGNSISMMEAFKLAESLSGKTMNWTYSETNRIGDHICYYSDLTKMRTHYPNWDITIDLKTMFKQIIDSWTQRLS